MIHLLEHRSSLSLIVAWIGICAALWMSIRATEPCLEAQDPVYDMRKVTAKARYPVTFVLHNSGSVPVRILGANSYCSKEGCVSWIASPQGTVEPGDLYEVKAMFRTPVAGPFSYRFLVYSDAPGQSSIFLTIQGESVPEGTVARSASRISRSEANAQSGAIAKGD
jgi:hypothetical protein